ncbi:ribosomal protein acetylating enzyme [Alphaproteobacteria bacterium]|nr:ribosomal protein acetylating enzyme [Alphaproteobacteria bacterium]
MKDFAAALTGKRVELRALEPTFANARAVYGAIDANRAHLAQFLDWVAETHAEETTLFVLNDWKDKRRSGTQFSYGIFVGGAYSGNIDVHHVSARHANGAVGYWLASDKTGQGYCAEALGLIEDEFFAGDGLHRLQIACDERNGDSAKVAEKAGYRLEGLLREVRVDPDQGTHFVGEKIFSKLKAEWEAKR